MKGKRNCQWLRIGSTQLCNRSCLGDYCKVHLARLRKSPGTKPCTICGKGVKNKYLLCHECGYHDVSSRDWACKARALKKEIERLAAIEISY